MNNIVTEKVCTKCGKTKTASDFRARIDRRNGRNFSYLNSSCKMCEIESKREYDCKHHEKNLQYGKEYRLLHPEKVKKANRKYRQSNLSKVIEAVRKWRTNNVEKIKEYSREYYKKNLEQQRIKSLKYHTENKEKVKEQYKKWISQNPGKNREYAEARRFRILGNGGVITADEWKSLCEKYGNKCLCCGVSDVRLTIDHVIPLKLGGTNTIDNAQPLCQSCNSRKSSKHIDYRGENGS